MPTTGALESARDVNGYVEAYLKGTRKIPKGQPGYYSPVAAGRRKCAPNSRRRLGMRTRKQSLG